MSSWVNRTLVQAPNNGTDSHTVSFAAATAGNLLVAVAYGGVTSSTPAGWTLPENGSAVNAGGLYVWYKTATDGESSFTTTHNASSYPVVFAVYEFPAGSAFVKAVAAVGQVSGAANPSLTAMTGTYSPFAMFGEGLGGAGATYTSATWSWGTEDVDATVPFSDPVGGYGFGLAYEDDVTADTWTDEPTLTHSGFDSQERITFAVTIGAGSATLAATPEDTLAFADAASAVRAGATAQTPNDPLGLADAVVLARGTSVTAADLLAVMDTPTQQTIGFTWADDDILALTDATSTTATVQRPAADTAAFMDDVTTALTGAGDIDETPADTIALTDIAAAVLGVHRVVADTLAVSDHASSTTTSETSVKVGTVDVTALYIGTTRVDALL